MSEVENLIQEQATTNLNLALLLDTKATFDDILLENMISNELLDTNSNAIVSLDKTLKSEITNLSSTIASFKLDEPEEFKSLPLPIETNFPLLPAPEGTVFDQSEVVNALTELQPIEPELRTVINEAEDDTQILSDISETGDDSVSHLSDINDGIQEIISRDETEEFESQKGVAVDRQKDSEASEGLFEGMGGKAAALAGKAGVIGAVALATGAIVKSVFDGLTDDKVIQDITGKARKDLTASEESFAILSNVVETLSFGLFSAKETFEAVQPLAEGFQKATDALFDPDEGVFGFFTSSVIKLFEGDIMGALEDTVIGIAKLPLKIFELGQKIGTALFDLLPTDIQNQVSDFITPITDPLFKFFFEDIPNTYQAIADTIKSGFDFIMDIPNKIETMVTNFTDSVIEGLTSAFDFVGDIASKIADSVSNFASDIINGIKGKAVELASDLPFGIGDKIVSLFDTIEAPEKKEPVQNKGIFKPILSKEAGENIPISKSPSVVDAEPTAKLSKERFDQQQVIVQSTPPQPIIIEKEKREEKKISRRTESNDMTLSMLGMGNF